MSDTNGAARIIELDELLPADITFVIDGQEHTAPGDLPVPVLLRLMQAFERLSALDGAEQNAENNAEVQDAIEGLHDQVVAVFRLRDADVQLELGMRSLVAITTHLIQAMGAQEDGARPTRPASRTRSRPARSTTARSTSSTPDRHKK